MWRRTLGLYRRCGNLGRSCILLGFVAFPLAGVGLALGLASPVFGLCIVACAPFMSVITLKWESVLRKHQNQREQVAAFYLLHGLMTAGVSLPSVLKEMEKSKSFPAFCRQLRLFSREFERGERFEKCLYRLSGSEPAEASAICFRAMQLAYAKGLEMGSLLASCLPLIEADAARGQKVLQLKKNAIAQGVLCATMPWFAWTAWRFVAPSADGDFGAYLIAVFVLEGAGLWAVHRASQWKSPHQRREWMAFLHTVTLFVRCGFDLRYAWEQANQQSAHVFSYRAVHERVHGIEASWWQILGKLYQQGGPVLAALEAFLRTIREEEAREMERFARELPLRLHLRLVVFFLPATLILLFFPMLNRLSQSAF